MANSHKLNINFYIFENQERDELTVKIEELEKTIEENTAREAELQKAADQARTLKDEVDILRETADKVKYHTLFETLVIIIANHIVCHV